jgi:hypothetical protein
MGGLLIRAMLARHADDELWRKIGRIAFIGTPHYGAPAMSFYLKNHFYGTDQKLILALVLSRSTFRSLYGALSLLPAPRGIYPGTRENDPAPWTSDDPDDAYVHPAANFDLHDASAWNLGASAVETANLQNVLNHARDFYKEITAHHLETLDNAKRGRMAVIAGVGLRTPFRMTIGENLLGFESVGKVTSRIPGDPHREGDGSGTLASACLESIGATRFVAGEHSALPNIPAVYEDVFAWLGGDKMKLPTTPQGALASHLGASATPELDGSDVPLGPEGRWDPDLELDAPPAQVLLDLDAGKYPQFHRVRIL